MTNASISWKTAKLGDVICMSSGQVDPRQQPYADYKHVGPENVETDTGSLSGIKTARELNLISGKYLFDEDAIVYCKIRPNLNKVCLPGFTGICSADAYPIWPKQGLLERDYLLQFMRSPIFVGQAVAVSMRTGMPKINQSDLNRLSIPVPPLTEQKAIAAILSAWDRAIGQTTALLAAKERLKQGLMQQLLSGKRRLRKFRDNWRSCHLGDVFSNRRQAGYAGLPMLSVTLDVGVVRRDSRDRSVRTSLDHDEHLLVRKGDIAYNMMRMWQGGSGMANEDGVVSPAYVVCQPNDKIDSRFADHFFHTPRMIFLFWAYSYGLTDDRRRLYFDGFSRIPVQPMALTILDPLVLRSVDPLVHGG